MLFWRTIENQVHINFTAHVLRKIRLKGYSLYQDYYILFSIFKKFIVKYSNSIEKHQYPKLEIKYKKEYVPLYLQRNDNSFVYDVILPFPIVLEEIRTFKDIEEIKFFGPGKK